jgi:hypothetical protein
MKAEFIVAAVLLCAATDASAGIKWLSRANCVAGVVNESVTYDRPALNAHWMKTTSRHVGFGSVGGHTISSAEALTWRAYAGDRFDRSRSTVTGTHYFVDEWNVTRVAQTIATDCNLGEW